METRFRARIVNIARQPVLQFLVLGLIIYLAYAWLGGPIRSQADTVIRVTVTDVDRLVASWQARWNRPPTEPELDGLIQDQIRQTALYRHSVAMGLDQDDPRIRRMLSQKLLNLTQNVMEYGLAPTDQELQEYFNEHADRYRSPDLISFTQVFVNPDRRGSATGTDAEAILIRLKKESPTGELVGDPGDSFMLPRYYRQESDLNVRKQFGRGFADTLFTLTAGEWHGPILSGYGVHLVYVRQLDQAEAPVLEDVRDNVTQEWIDSRVRELQNEYVTGVVAAYEVIVEDSTRATLRP